MRSGSAFSTCSRTCFISVSPFIFPGDCCISTTRRGGCGPPAASTSLAMLFSSLLHREQTFADFLTPRSQLVNKTFVQSSMFNVQGLSERPLPSNTTRNVGQGTFNVRTIGNSHALNDWNDLNGLNG